MKKKLFFATLVAAMLLVLVMATPAFAARNNYSDWFDLDRINAIDVEEDLRDEATREEVALLIAELCNELELLPSSRTLSFNDEERISEDIIEAYMKKEGIKNKKDAMKELNVLYIGFSSSKSQKLIEQLTSAGIICGYPEGNFWPGKKITRAEAITVVLRAVDYFCLETESYSRGSYFTDTEGHWAEVYCQRAYNEGLVSGRGNGRFYPDDDITREEIITILVNLMGESNNPLICAIDKIYDLEFDNAYYVEEENDRYYDDDRYYGSNNRYNGNDRYYGNNRYDDEEYEEATKRPVVNTGNSTTSSSSSSTSTSGSTSTSINNVRPERPVVDTTTNNNSSTTSNTSDGSQPSRPDVDTTTPESTSSQVGRPTVGSGSDSTASSRPTRPTF